MPESLDDNLNNLVAGKSGNDIVFESERGGKLTAITTQKIFENTLRDSDVKKI